MDISLRAILLMIGGVIIAFIAIDAFRRHHKKHRLQEKRFERAQSHTYGRPIDDLSADLDDILLVDEGPDLLDESLPSIAAEKPKKTAYYDEPNLLFDDFDSDDSVSLYAEPDTEFSVDPYINTNADYHYDDEPSISASAPAYQKPAQPKPAQPKQDAAIVLHVLAEDDLEYEGRSLVRLLTSLGLRFGDKGIFHRHESHHLKSAILFHAASAVEPGTFSIKEADNFSTPGVTLFFLLSSVDEPLEAYEIMLETANRLAESLDADVFDEKHQSLSPQIINAQRQRILNFMQQDEIA